MDQTCDILIIGAGAAGLMAAYRLSGSGKKITVLEARDRIGGRIHTLQQPPFTQPVELGAEFVHGPLPLTLTLLKKAGIDYEVMKGEAWTCSGGRFHQEDAIGKDWPLLMRKLDSLETDCTIREFLEREFGDEKYRELRQWVTRFTEGYDAADADKASAIALREEWKGEEEEQYRINGGYGRLMRYLQEQCDAEDVLFVCSQPVTEIQWSPGAVTATTGDGSVFRAAKAVLTLPMGLWQQESKAPKLTPVPEAQMNAINEIGYGQVIKFLLQFREPFWQGKEAVKRLGCDLSKLGFLFSDEDIPTWWTRYPAPDALLTGWLAGPQAGDRQHLDQETLLETALQSLSRIFRLSVAELKANLGGREIANWSADPCSLGAYAYATVPTAAARKLLAEPVADTLFFAGEALYDGPAMGTVEAALNSGHAVAWKIAGNLIRI